MGDVLISLTAVMISLCICIPNHYVVYLKIYTIFIKNKEIHILKRIIVWRYSYGEEHGFFWKKSCLKKSRICKHFYPLSWGLRWQSKCWKENSHHIQMQFRHYYISITIWKIDWSFYLWCWADAYKWWI